MENIFIENADGQMEINFQALELLLGSHGERFIKYFNQQILEGWEIVKVGTVSHFEFNVWLKDSTNLIQHLKYRKYHFELDGYSYEYYNGYDLLILLNALGGAENFHGAMVKNYDWRKEV